MYGLKQAAILAFQQLAERLETVGYSQILGNSGMWKHKTRQTVLCFCVDHFGVKYFSKEDAYHLLNTLGTHYKYMVDWTGCNFCGLIFEWNYTDGYVNVSILGHIKDALRKLKHKPIRSHNILTMNTFQWIMASMIHPNTPLHQAGFLHLHPMK